MLNSFIPEAEEKMKKTIARISQEFAAIRTGRAAPAILDRIEVEYYGTPTPIKQMASVSTPDARTIAIQPYERTALATIERAILKSDLGLTPTNDGQMLRLNFPPLTTDRRKELVKLARKEGEEGKVAIRNVRRDEHEKIKAAEKKSELTQDEAKRLNEQLQKVTDRFVAEIDRLMATKEAEIMEV